MHTFHLLAKWVASFWSSACGFPLRAEDPAAMKEFILTVQSRTADLKAGPADDKAPIGKRVCTYL